MNKSNFFYFAIVLALSLASFSSALGQQNSDKIAEPNFEIVLQTLISSNQSEAEKAIPASLSATINKLKSNYNFAGYRLLSTHLQRVSNKGSVSHTSLFDELNTETEDRVFSNWALRNLTILNGSNQQNIVKFHSFNFNARLPIKTGTIEKDGETKNLINYERIGLMIESFSVPENQPTLIGTLGMPKSDQVIFFVLTVKPIN